MLQLISFTGADDKTDLPGLHALALNGAMQHNVIVEAALLIFPEKTGRPRNPSYATRQTIRGQQHSAAHLCGDVIFRALIGTASSIVSHTLQPLLAELTFYNRVQVNINARRDDFTEEEMHQVWYKLLTHCQKSRIILQYHDRSADAIVSFINRLSIGDLPALDKVEAAMQLFLPQARDWEQRVQILVDGSKGTGTVPESWKIRDLDLFRRAHNLHVGMAGGLHAGNIAEEYKRFQLENDGFAPVWADLESGARIGNEFSIIRCDDVINAIAPIQETKAS